MALENAPDVIMARALASLDKLFEYCEKWIIQNPDVVFIFPKGQNFENELLACEQNWGFVCEQHMSKIDPQSVILVFQDVKRL